MSTAVQKRPSQQLKELLEVNKPKIAAMISLPGLNADKLVRSVMLAVANTPTLAECDHVSVLMSVMKAAQLGLDPTGTLGGAYLVPYKVKGQKVCTLQIGYRGLIDLARRSGAVLSVEAHVVYEADHFDILLGTKREVIHRPFIGQGDRGKPVAVYAVASLAGGGEQFDWMTHAQVEAVRLRSAAGEGGPWLTDWDEMAKKTVVKRLCKYLPLTTELQTALDVDNVPAVSVGTQPPPGVTSDGEIVVDSATDQLAAQLDAEGA